MTNNKPKKKPRGRPFPKGTTGNPKGRGASIPILKVFKQYTATAVAEIYTELMNFTKDELNLIIADKGTNALRVIIAQVLVRDMTSRDMNYSERVLQRIIGPIPAVQEIGGVGGAPLPPPAIYFNPVTPAPAPKEGEKPVVGQQ